MSTQKNEILICDFCETSIFRKNRFFRKNRRNDENREFSKKSSRESENSFFSKKRDFWKKQNILFFCQKSIKKAIISVLAQIARPFFQNGVVLKTKRFFCVLSQKKVWAKNDTQPSRQRHPGNHRHETKKSPKSLARNISREAPPRGASATMPRPVFPPYPGEPDELNLKFVLELTRCDDDFVGEYVSPEGSGVRCSTPSHCAECVFPPSGVCVITLQGSPRVGYPIHRDGMGVLRGWVGSGMGGGGVYLNIT